MPETFLILLSGGIMFAVAISDPKQVTARWRWLAGILALVMAGLATFFGTQSLGVRGVEIFAVPMMFILGQLVLVGFEATQQIIPGAASAIAIAIGTLSMYQTAPSSIPILALTCAFAAVTMGLALMDMLLGHAYLTASQMTMAPFMRLNRTLAVAMLGRAILSIPVSLFLQSRNPIEMFWNLNGLYIGTRWLVGLAVPGVFIYMAHDCIKRRATQSATGILYVAGVLIFIGEIIGLHLIRETGLPL